MFRLSDYCVSRALQFGYWCFDKFEAKCNPNGWNRHYDGYYK